MLPSKVFPHNDVNIKISSVDNWTFNGQIEFVYEHTFVLRILYFISGLEVIVKKKKNKKIKIKIIVKCQNLINVTSI